MKKIAVFLGHPAHYHMFKNMVRQLESDGYQVEYLIKRKDILEKLVQESGHSYVVVRGRERSSTCKMGLIRAMFSMDLKVTGYLCKHKPALLIGTYAPFISHLTGVPMLICCEDDAAVVPWFARLSYPYASDILCPVCCDGGKWERKITKYRGYQKLTYLHPNRFTPDEPVVHRYFGTGYKPYVLLRFSKLNAHHDRGVGGVNDQIAQRLIACVGEGHDIYITSERPLGPDLEKYRLHINPPDIHHIMAFASLYIGDSQSMAVEAAMLGTPNIRFNDFAGKIGVLEELEHTYGLSVGIPSDKPQDLYDRVTAWLGNPDLHAEFQGRRRKMLADKIDVTSFFVWLIENYPESHRILREDPHYAEKFME